jgi:hypothetical protein
MGNGQQQIKKPHTLKAPQYKNVYFSVKWKWKQTKYFESKSFHSPILKRKLKSPFQFKKTCNEYTIYELGVSFIKKPTLLGLP